MLAIAAVAGGVAAGWWAFLDDGSPPSAPSPETGRAVIDDALTGVDPGDPTEVEAYLQSEDGELVTEGMAAVESVIAGDVACERLARLDPVRSPEYVGAASAVPDPYLSEVGVAASSTVERLVLACAARSGLDELFAMLTDASDLYSARLQQLGLA